MSEIKVNKISPKQTCTQVTLGDSGDDIVVASGVNFKTPSVKDASGNIIISRCGSNITIGSSGASIALACGASQTGFGRTGTVDWDTTAKTALFTAVSGNGYFVNTTSGAITVTLPATPSAGDIVAVKDYANTFDTNNVTLARNGSNIGGAAIDATLSTEGLAVTLVYVDATKGWLVTDNGTQDTAPTAAYIVATGGNTITTDGDFKVHAFTSPGTFTVCSVGNPAGSTTVQYMVVAGGGGGSNSNGGGGGAGGFRMASCFTAPATAYPITVGGGGAGNPAPLTARGASGTVSTFSTITSAGGGGGGSGIGPAGAAGPGADGGSGGGGGTNNECGGAGNTPATPVSQGNNGGDGAGPGTPSPQSGGGGGGASAVGGTHDAGGPAAGGNGSPAAPIFGAAPKAFYIANGPANGVSVCGTFAGGGGGGRQGAPVYPGGTGGGGNGTTGPATGANGTTNTGGGGGGGGYNPPGAGGNGGSGIVLIRYKFQN